MKLKMFSINLLFFLSSTSLLFSQDPLIEGLFDPSFSIRRETIFTIMDQNLEEYVPYIEEAIFIQPEPFMIYTYLKALDLLHSPNIVEFTLEFMNRADEFGGLEPAEDPLEMKVRATTFLFNAGDYSAVNYVFEIINRDRPNVNPYALVLLGRILNEVPDFYEMARDELIYIMNDAPDEISRFNAMFYLNEFSGTDVIMEFVNKFINDPELTVRNQALGHLFNLNYINIKDLLLQRLSEDPSEVMRARIADSILTVYGEPIDLQTVIDYRPNEPDPEIGTWIQFAIDDFIPPNQAFPSLDARILNLISYTGELYEYEWITEEETYNYYQDKLYELREAIEAGFDEEACTIIYDGLLNKIDQGEQEDLITTEGYKFLYYHTVYIKEIFEEEIGGCQ